MDSATSVDLHNIDCDGDTVIAEWEARFHDIPSGARQIREVAI